MRKKKNVNYSVKARVYLNRSLGFRRKVGNFLRKIANLIDARHSLSIEIETNPPISDKEKNECIVRATRLIGGFAASYAEAEALENVLRDNCARLFVDDKTNKQGV